ncbi:crocetin glucosyltransferase, chloroplastic [Eucalyptus grandis]|uniref:crocetin glucosyltransferase, chloroplastic n=1 Tax=Eucalyptus grandis TaxID=71139 RepID=UPI00192EEDFF|nr:crocetin glucosyltransferase, chloroplastic [Eucalyptus grandis]
MSKEFVQASSMAPPHFLLVTFPSQGHINPSLQFAKRLVRVGAHVTFATAIHAHHRMAESKSPPEGLSFASFSDGYDDGIDWEDLDGYMDELKRQGSETLSNLIASNLENGRRFLGVFYTTLLPWVADVARSHGIPSTLVWIQPATVLDFYYYYFHGYGDLIQSTSDNPSVPIQLPGLPPLMACDIPSFCNSKNVYNFSLPFLQRHFEILLEEAKPRILTNTFDALEPDAIRAIDKFEVIGIGPLIPSAFLDGQDPSDTSFGGDLFKSSSGYMEWLDTKPKASVIYLSFGSISVLSKPQKEEMARALVEVGRPFLWVIRESGKEERDEDRLSFQEELDKLGMIVLWCSQVEVLSHPSVGCFVTHCGWNSTSESLVCGVPMVAFPQWSDQLTNAKLVADVWRTGVKMTPNELGLVESGEMKRCLELVVGDGEEGEEMRRNARKFRDLAREAVKEGGSSDKNLRAFVDEAREAAE